MLTPILLQTIHLFEKHEHNDFSCTAIDEQHFHEHEDTDCSQFHYQFEVFSTEITSNFTPLATHFFTNNYNEYPQLINGIHFTKLSDRGPPLA